jgi:carboxylesterase
MPVGRRARWGLIIVAGLVLFWLGGDFVYSRIVLHRVNRWERSIRREPDGVRAGCRERTLGEGRAALLFVHGFNDCPAIFDRLAPRLAERGYTCRLMRLPGFATPVETYSRSTRAQWLEAVEQEIANLRATHERVGVVAHSLGGAITVRHLLDHPRTVDGVVLLAPLIDVSDARSPVLSPRAWHRLGNRVLFFTRVVETPFGLSARSPEARAYDLNTRFTPREIFEQLYALLDEIDGRAGEFDAPLLLVLGRQDEVIDRIAAERFLEQSNSPVKVVVVLDDAGHQVPLDHGWETLPDEIVRFLPPLLD